jgi:hypothetical protein
MDDELTVIGSPMGMARSETLPPSLDFSGWLAEDETITGATAELIRLNTGENTPEALNGDPSISEGKVTVVVDGSALIEGESYSLEVNAIISDAKKPTAKLIINCVS